VSSKNNSIGSAHYNSKKTLRIASENTMRGRKESDNIANNTSLHLHTRVVQTTSPFISL
jgi:hypothetical protein